MSCTQSTGICAGTVSSERWGHSLTTSRVGSVAINLERATPSLHPCPPSPPGPCPHQSMKDSSSLPSAEHDTSYVQHKHDVQPGAVLSIGAAAGAGPATGGTPTRSIYSLWSRRQRRIILAVVSVSQFLNPFSSSIMVPSLKVCTTQGLPLEAYHDTHACFPAAAEGTAFVLNQLVQTTGCSPSSWQLTKQREC